MSDDRSAPGRLHSLARFLWAGHSGQAVVLLLLTAYFLNLLALSRAEGIVAAWRKLGVAAIAPSFADMRVITTGLDSQRLGHDPLKDNPRDPFGRQMNYPRVWLALSWLGLGEGQTEALGVGLAATFYITVLLVMGRSNAAHGLIVAIVLCSPPVMLAVERGNCDLVVFVLLAGAAVLVRSRPRLRPLLYLSIVVSAVLKLYPMAAMPVAWRDKRRQPIIWTAVMCMLFVAYLFFTRADIALISQATPRPSWMAYGRLVAFQLLAQNGEANHVPGTDQMLVALSIAAVGVLGVLAFGWGRRLKLESSPSRNVDLFLVGSGIYVGTFLIGNNWDYRLAFLILLLPQLFDWSQEDGQQRQVSSLLIFAVLLSLWGEFPLSLFMPRMATLLQELANWLAFAVTLALSTAILSTDATRTWLPLEGKR